MATYRWLAVLEQVLACVAIGGSERFWNMFQNGSRTQRLRITFSRCGIARHCVLARCCRSTWLRMLLHSGMSPTGDCLAIYTSQLLPPLVRFEMMAVYMQLQKRVGPGRRCPQSS